MNIAIVGTKNFDKFSEYNEKFEMLSRCMLWGNVTHVYIRSCKIGDSVKYYMESVLKHHSYQFRPKLIMFDDILQNETWKYLINYITKIYVFDNYKDKELTQFQSVMKNSFIIVKYPDNNDVKQLIVHEVI